MGDLHFTPPRHSTRRAAIDASARLAAMLTPARGRRSTAGVGSAAEEQDAAAVVKNSSKEEFRDEDSLSSAESSEADEVECCICLEEPSADDIATINGCEHRFCLNCIAQWSNANHLCPLCRTRFTSIESAGGVLLHVPVRRVVVANLVRAFNLEEVVVGSGDGGNDERFAVLRRNIEPSETRQVTQQMLEMEEILERVRMRVQQDVDQQILEMEEMVQSVQLASVQLAVLLEQAEENTQRIENLMSS